MQDINSCTEPESDRNCWHITPVKLADPVKYKIIPEQTTVRTLGIKLILFYFFSVFLPRLGSNWRILDRWWTVRVAGTIGRNGEQLCPSLSPHRDKCGWEWCRCMSRRFWGTTTTEGWKGWMGSTWNFVRGWVQLWEGGYSRFNFWVEQNLSSYWMDKLNHKGWYFFRHVC